jgi:AbrB family looped-hinge helix DNA binding protein
MQNTRLSSKGQVVIPKKIRDELKIEVGTLLRVKLAGKKITLEPLEKSAKETLYGKYPRTKLLQGLESEHEAEIKKELHS